MILKHQYPNYDTHPFLPFPLPFPSLPLLSLPFPFPFPLRSLPFNPYIILPATRNRRKDTYLISLALLHYFSTSLFFSLSLSLSPYKPAGTIKRIK